MLAPTKAGLVSTVDVNVSVIDTGTQSFETLLLTEVDIRCVWEKALDWGVQGMS